jgi:predicted transcriptional regulator
MNRTIASPMTPHPIVVDASEPISIARDLLLAHGIRHLAVVSKGRIVGAIGEHELRAAGPEADRRDPRVEERMDADPVLTPSTASVADVAKRMAERSRSVALVVDDERLVGIFTERDAVALVSASADEGSPSPTCDRWGHVVGPEERCRPATSMDAERRLP